MTAEQIHRMVKIC